MKRNLPFAYAQGSFHINVKRGFTLIEMLIALAVFSMLGVMATVILVGALQGAKKAAAVALVKNEGSRVINTMTQMLKYSTSVTLCGGNSVTFQPRTDTSNPAVFACLPPGAGPYYIASNSANLTSGNVEMTSCNISCDVPDVLAKQVNINFTLQMKNATFATENADTTFKTQIELRNQEQ